MVNSKTSPKVAFLVVTWNNRDIIDECLDALKKQSYHNTATYLIDNASKDDTAAHVAEKYPDVDLIASRFNNGFAKGNNILIREALKDKDVEFVALVNSDAMLDKDWTSELVKHVSGKSNVAAAQGLTLDYYDHNIIDADHIYLRPNFQSVQHGYRERVNASNLYPRRVFGVNAAAALYSRAFIEAQPQKNFFDEKFFMYLEDVDVSFRALLLGWDNFFVPSAKAYHMGSASSKKRSSTFNIEMTIRNQSALLFKNMPTRTFFSYLVRALKFEKHFYTYMNQTFGKDAARAVLRSRIVGILRLPLYIRDRYRTQRRRKLSPKQLERIMTNEGIV